MATDPTAAKADVEVVCSICNGVMTDAADLPCGHAYCFGCITKTLAERQGHGLCPLCREPAKAADLNRNRVLERLAAAHEVPCRYAERGCGFVGKRDDAKAHAETCAFLPAAEVVAAKTKEFSKELSDRDAEIERLKKRLAEAEDAVEARDHDIRGIRAKLDAAQEILAKRSGCRWGRMVKDGEGDIEAAEVRFASAGDEYTIVFSTEKGSPDVGVWARKERGFRKGAEYFHRTFDLKLVHPNGQDFKYTANCEKTVRPGERWGTAKGFHARELDERSVAGHYFVGVI